MLPTGVRKIRDLDETARSGVLWAKLHADYRRQ
jgi:hypothetical protein